MAAGSSTADANRPSNKKRTWILGLCVLLCIIMILQEDSDPCLLAVEPLYDNVSEQYVYQDLIIPRDLLWRRSHDNALVFCVCEFRPCLPVCCPQPNFQHLHDAECQNHTNNFSKIFNNTFNPMTIYVPQNMTYKSLMHFEEDKILISTKGVLSYYNRKRNNYENIGPFFYCVVANVVENALDDVVDFTYNIYQRFDFVEITEIDIANMMCKYLCKYTRCKEKYNFNMFIFVHLLAVSIISSFVGMIILAKFYNNDKVRSSLIGKLVMIMLIWPTFSSFSNILILFMPIPAMPCYFIAVGTYFIYLIHLNAILACAIEVTRLQLTFVKNVPINTARRSFKNEFCGIICFASLMMIVVLIIDHINDVDVSIWKPNLGVDTCYLGIQYNNFPMLLYHILPGLAILTATLIHLYMTFEDEPLKRNLKIKGPEINVVNIPQQVTILPANTETKSNGDLDDDLNADMTSNGYNKLIDEPNYM